GPRVTEHPNHAPCRCASSTHSVLPWMGTGCQDTTPPASTGRSALSIDQTLDLGDLGIREQGGMGRDHLADLRNVLHLAERLDPVFGLVRAPRIVSLDGRWIVARHGGGGPNSVLPVQEFVGSEGTGPPPRGGPADAPVRGDDGEALGARVVPEDVLDA